MKVAIKNLGAVREAEIELKPLTVFVGPNNAGKTWTANLLSAILGPIGFKNYAAAYSRGISGPYLLIEDAINQLLYEGNAKIDLEQFLDEYGSKYFNDVALLSRSWSQEFFETKLVSFENLEVDINIDNKKDYLINAILTASLDSKLSIGKEEKGLLNAIKERRETTLYFFTTGSGLKDKVPLRAIREFIAVQVFAVLHRALYYDVYFFPAERTAFTSFVMSDKIDQRPERNDGKIDEPEKRYIAGPISNLLETITTIRSTGSLAARQEAAKNNDKISLYLDLANVLQKSILGGRLDFSSPEPDILREVIFEPSVGNGITLDMPVVSSMVKELSTLVLYLRYMAQPRDLLVIDEPEMHLHPEAQAKLTEFLAMLVNAGLNIIITTHSPYLVDHLVNLMIAAEHSDQESIKDKFYLKRTDPFIPKENVSVYLFENGTAKNILGEEGFIDWETFSEVSEDILQIKLEL